MDLKTLVYLSLVYLWCSIYAGRILLIVTAQTTLTADIITPEADRKEGGQVRMECTASNFDFQNDILVWQKDGITLKRNEETVTSDPRFFLSTRHEMNMVTIEQLVITGVHRNDSGIYTCNANATSTSSSSNIVSPAQVTLSVLYLPSEAFPICSPAGPITVNAGTELNMQCSSEVGNPHVMMEISETKYNDTFSTSDLDGMTSISLNLIAYVTYNNVRFLCTISSPMYYPGMSRSCSIGPITVNDGTESPTTLMTESTQNPLITSQTSPSNDATIHTTDPLTEPTPIPTTEPTSTGAAVSSVPLLSGLVAAILLLVISSIVNVLLVIVVLRQKRLIKSLTDEKVSQEPAAEPYMELQSKSKNTVYMEPVVREAEDAAERHTYSQADEEEAAATDHHNNRHEDTMTSNTEYEDVNYKQNR